MNQASGKDNSAIESRQKIHKTPLQLETVKSIDACFLSDCLTDWVQDRNQIDRWKGKCPFCSGIKSKHRMREQGYRPASLFPGHHGGVQEGYVFHCCACKTSLTTYKFLRATHGVECAETYAQTRWDSGQLCGEGWNCPIPESVKIALEQERKIRKTIYRDEYEAKRRENYLRKYGPQQTSS